MDKQEIKDRLVNILFDIDTQVFPIEGGVLTTKGDEVLHESYEALLELYNDIQ